VQGRIELQTRLNISLLALAGAPHLGRVEVPIDEVTSGQKTEGWFDLVGPTATKKNGEPMKAQVWLVFNKDA